LITVATGEAKCVTRSDFKDASARRGIDKRGGEMKIKDMAAHE
jgi:hypothetical protein